MAQLSAIKARNLSSEFAQVLLDLLCQASFCHVRLGLTTHVELIDGLDV